MLFFSSVCSISGVLNKLNSFAYIHKISPMLLVIIVRPTLILP